ncbi:hypothetical protein [Paraburkholderia acidisoli]|uniref:hypothetical protein n=1 Tax=Paraburkholderia acidisoli TaxID=2571748 RepID=UPI0018EF12DF|nr:hypothetical protein [Paraburkholderia acidisoli]
MTHERFTLPKDDPIWAEARALEASIRVIRRAQGKRNPQDLEAGSSAWLEAMEDFAHDVARVVAQYPNASAQDDDSELHGAGAAG